MKCLYEGCIKIATIGQFCDSCKENMIGAEERLNNKKGIISGHMSRYSIEPDINYDLVTEMNLEEKVWRHNRK